MGREEKMLVRSIRATNSSDEPSCEIEGVTTELDFARVLLRERDRADRTHDTFTLVVFEVDEAQRKDAAWCRTLGRVVRERLRSTDEAGWLEESRLGFSLPHTPVSGAWSFVEALRTTFELQTRRHSPLRFSVYSHTGGGGDEGNGGTPSRRNGRHALRIHEGATAAGQGSAMALETLLFQPTGAAKRAVDLVLASVGMVLALPVMAIAALAIKCTSRGPVLFRQDRAGYGGRPFAFLKLRTMVDGAEQMKGALTALNEADGPVFKITRDPRVTLVGRFLRKTSMDELPQLWNVLRGDMSIVGPRPPTLDEIVKYASWQRRRLHAMGGLTCLWQVGGRSNVGFLDWMRLDLRYLRHRTLGMDLLLILRTIPAVLVGRGAK